MVCVFKVHSFVSSKLFNICKVCFRLVSQLNSEYRNMWTTVWSQSIVLNDFWLLRLTATITGRTHSHIQFLLWPYGEKYSAFYH